MRFEYEPGVTLAATGGWQTSLREAAREGVTPGALRDLKRARLLAAMDWTVDEQQQLDAENELARGLEVLLGVAPADEDPDVTMDRAVAARRFVQRLHGG